MPLHTLTVSFLLTAMLLCGVDAKAQSASEMIAPTFRTKESVVKAFGDISVPKGEFDTTEEFSSKKCRLYYQKAGGGEETIYHFPIYGMGALSEAYYDADKKKFRFLGAETFPSVYSLLSIKSGVALILNRQSTSGKGYVGQNAFGVSARIAVSEEKTIAVIVPNQEGFPMLNDFSLSVEPDVARGLKGDLQLVVSTKIASPCIDFGFHHTKPTIDSPSETTDRLVALIGSADATWEIIKRSTGEVLTSGSFEKRPDHGSGL